MKHILLTLALLALAGCSNDLTVDEVRDWLDDRRQNGAQVDAAGYKTLPMLDGTFIHDFWRDDADETIAHTNLYLPDYEYDVYYVSLWMWHTWCLEFMKDKDYCSAEFDRRINAERTSTCDKWDDKHHGAWCDFVEVSP